MNERVKWEECADLCQELRREMEDDCQVPPYSLGGEMLPAYERARKEHLEVMKEIERCVQTLRNIAATERF